MERRCANFAAYLRFTAFGLFVGACVLRGGVAKNEPSLHLLCSVNNHENHRKHP